MALTDRIRLLGRRALSGADAKAMIRDHTIIAFGAAVYAVSVDFFTSPNGIAPGGITGIATMLNHLLYVPIGASALLLNIPLFIWAAIENGARFVYRTVAASVMASVFIDLIALVPVSYTGSRMLAAIFGGLLSGAGLGLILLRGGSTGGTDIIGRNLHNRYPYLSVGSIILISDVVVIGMSAIVYGSIENALYAVIAIFTSTRVIDAVVFGFSRDNGKLLIIITAQAEAVRDALLNDADRGVTLLDARGGFSGDPRGVIFCATHTRDVYRVKSCVGSADPEAFIITATATAISGLGFTN